MHWPSYILENQVTAVDETIGQVARGLLGIPAASTSSERSFSSAGWTVNERRTQLSGDSVDGLLFLHELV